MNSSPRLFWVTVARGSTVRIAAGPFRDHATAATFVEPARRLANRLDPTTNFDGFGVTSGTVRPDRRLPRGLLNDHLGVPAIDTHPEPSATPGRWSPAKGPGGRCR